MINASKVMSLILFLNFLTKNPIAEKARSASTLVVFMVFRLYRVIVNTLDVLWDRFHKGACLFLQVFAVLLAGRAKKPVPFPRLNALPYESNRWWEPKPWKISGKISIFGFALIQITSSCFIKHHHCTFLLQTKNVLYKYFVLPTTIRQFKKFYNWL